MYSSPICSKEFGNKKAQVTMGDNDSTKVENPRKQKGARIYFEFDVKRSKTSSLYRQISRSPFPTNFTTPAASLFLLLSAHRSVCLYVYIYPKAAGKGARIYL